MAFKFPPRTRTAALNETMPKGGGKDNGSMPAGEKGKGPKTPKPMKRGKGK